MFDSLHRIFCVVFNAALAVLLVFRVFKLGFLAMVVGLAVAALLTMHRLWLAVFVGVLLGLN